MTWTLWGIDLALETAKEASGFGVTEHIPDFSPEATKPTADVSVEMIEPVPVGDLITTLVDVEKRLLEAHPAIASVPYNGLAQRDINRFYLNSAGALRQEARSYASLYL